MATLPAAVDGSLDLKGQGIADLSAVPLDSSLRRLSLEDNKLRRLKVRQVCVCRAWHTVVGSLRGQWADRKLA